MKMLRLRNTATLIQRIKFHLAPYFRTMVIFSLAIAIAAVGVLVL